MIRHGESNFGSLILKTIHKTDFKSLSSPAIQIAMVIKCLQTQLLLNEHQRNQQTTTCKEDTQKQTNR
jgi:hypothetical protein